MQQRRPARAAVYTVGYQQRTAEEFVAELCSAGVTVLIDVRETPWSHRTAFSKSNLATLMQSVQITYVHARFAGNPKSIRSGAASVRECLQNYRAHLRRSVEIVLQFETLIASMLADGEKVCLLCYEQSPAECHRSVLLDEWARVLERDIEVYHLGVTQAAFALE